MKNKGLVMKSIIVVTVLLMVMSIVFISSSYMMERRIYNDELLSLHTTLTKNIEIEKEGIAGAANKLKSMDSSQYAKDNNIVWIQESLNSMVRDNFISNSYLLAPGFTERDGKFYLKVLQGNDSFVELGNAPGSEYEIKPELVDAIHEMERTGVGFSDIYEDLDGEWITVLKPINNDRNETIAVFAVDFNNKKIDGDLNSMLWEIIGIGSSIGIVFIIVIAFLIRRLVRPLTQLSVLSTRVAAGDLTVSIPVRSKDEIGVLSDSFNTMIAQIKHLVTNVKTTADQVAESSQQLTVIATQTSQSSYEISNSIQEVATGSESQMQGAEESKAAMEEIAIGIQRIAESSSAVSELSIDATESVDQGNQVVQLTVKQMAQIRNSVSRSEGITQSLLNQSEKIEHIVSIIGNVAVQTNLLALNASIEAARAGEHGRGFGVVAQEVRKLAEQTKDSTEQIAEMLNTVIAHTKELAEAMGENTEQAEQGTLIVQEAGEHFSKIWTSVQQVTEQIQEVSAAAEEMSAGSEEVAATLDNLASIAKDSSLNTQSVAASTEEQLAIVEEISDTATLLNRKMQDLQEELRKFTI
ncbi:methyl-accepting chemotaxis protein [Paenibacillus sp. MER 180]|uniref:methyl-accepting chemotaxis protein n=1 Tax=Paenibacillus sp. MER 180 TaxID=2939570 RepID=UPI00203C8FDB|nr:methyl-accepting chemotaxis protein [Paenibacillus sp. MER 180]MCM3290853.1 methyl-accepting chemotaxis protein [Paenibacillus sp. MER 180]